MSRAYEGRSYLDELYADRPAPPPKFLWPVFDDPFYATKPVQWFDTESEAIAFVHAALGKVNLYIGEPVYRKKIARKEAA